MELNDKLHSLSELTQLPTPAELEDYQRLVNEATQQTADLSEDAQEQLRGYQKKLLALEVLRTQLAEVDILIKKDELVSAALKIEPDPLFENLREVQQLKSRLESLNKERYNLYDELKKCNDRLEQMDPMDWGVAEKIYDKVKASRFEKLWPQAERVKARLEELQKTRQTEVAALNQQYQGLSHSLDGPALEKAMAELESWQTKDDKLKELYNQLTARKNEVANLPILLDEAKRALAGNRFKDAIEFYDNYLKINPAAEIVASRDQAQAKLQEVTMVQDTVKLFGVTFKTPPEMFEWLDRNKNDTAEGEKLTQDILLSFCQDAPRKLVEFVAEATQQLKQGQLEQLPQILSRYRDGYQQWKDERLWDYEDDIDFKYNFLPLKARLAILGQQIAHVEVVEKVYQQQLAVIWQTAQENWQKAEQLKPALRQQIDEPQSKQILDLYKMSLADFEEVSMLLAQADIIEEAHHILSYFSNQVKIKQEKVKKSLTEYRQRVCHPLATQLELELAQPHVLKNPHEVIKPLLQQLKRLDSHYPTLPELENRVNRLIKVADNLTEAKTALDNGLYQNAQQVLAQVFELETENRDAQSLSESATNLMAAMDEVDAARQQYDYVAEKNSLDKIGRLWNNSGPWWVERQKEVKQQLSQGDNFRQTMHEAEQAHHAGEYDQAISLLKPLLAQNPTPEQAKTVQDKLTLWGQVTRQRQWQQEVIKQIDAWLSEPTRAQLEQADRHLNQYKASAQTKSYAHLLLAEDQAAIELRQQQITALRTKFDALEVQLNQLRSTLKSDPDWAACQQLLIELVPLRTANPTEARLMELETEIRQRQNRLTTSADLLTKARTAKETADYITLLELTQAILEQDARQEEATQLKQESLKALDAQFTALTKSPRSDHDHLWEVERDTLISYQGEVDFLTHGNFFPHAQLNKWRESLELGVTLADFKQAIKHSFWTKGVELGKILIGKGVNYQWIQHDYARASAEQTLVEGVKQLMAENYEAAKNLFEAAEALGFGDRANLIKAKHGLALTRSKELLLREEYIAAQKALDGISTPEERAELTEKIKRLADGVQKSSIFVTKAMYLEATETAYESYQILKELELLTFTQKENHAVVKRYQECKETSRKMAQTAAEKLDNWSEAQRIYLKLCQIDPTDALLQQETGKFLQQIEKKGYELLTEISELVENPQSARADLERVLEDLRQLRGLEIKLSVLKKKDWDEYLAGLPDLIRALKQAENLVQQGQAALTQGHPSGDYRNCEHFIGQAKAFFKSETPSFLRRFEHREIIRHLEQACGLHKNKRAKLVGEEAEYKLLITALADQKFQPTLTTFGINQVKRWLNEHHEKGQVALQKLMEVAHSLATAESIYEIRPPGVGAWADKEATFNANKVALETLYQKLLSQTNSYETWHEAKAKSDQEYDQTITLPPINLVGKQEFIDGLIKVQQELCNYNKGLNDLLVETKPDTPWATILVEIGQSWLKQVEKEKIDLDTKVAFAQETLQKAKLQQQEVENRENLIEELNRNASTADHYWNIVTLCAEIQKLEPTHPRITGWKSVATQKIAEIEAANKTKQNWLVVAVVIFAIVLIVGLGLGVRQALTPTVLPTPTMTNTPRPTRTPTPAPASTNTPLPTTLPSPTPSLTPNPTATAEPPTPTPTFCTVRISSAEWLKTAPNPQAPNTEVRIPTSSSVQVLDAVTGTDNQLWNKIRLGSTEGFFPASYINCN